MYDADAFATCRNKKILQVRQPKQKRAVEALPGVWLRRGGLAVSDTRGNRVGPRRCWDADGDERARR